MLRAALGGCDFDVDENEALILGGGAEACVGTVRSVVSRRVDEIAAWKASLQSRRERREQRKKARERALHGLIEAGLGRVALSKVVLESRLRRQRSASDKRLQELICECVGEHAKTQLKIKAETAANKARIDDEARTLDLDSKWALYLASLSRKGTLRVSKAWVENGRLARRVDGASKWPCVIKFKTVMPSHMIVTNEAIAWLDPFVAFATAFVYCRGRGRPGVRVGTTFYRAARVEDLNQPLYCLLGSKLKRLDDVAVSELKAAYLGEDSIAQPSPPEDCEFTVVAKRLVILTEPSSVTEHTAHVVCDWRACVASPRANRRCAWHTALKNFLDAREASRFLSKKSPLLSELADGKLAATVQIFCERAAAEPVGRAVALPRWTKWRDPRELTEAANKLKRSVDISEAVAALEKAALMELEANGVPRTALTAIRKEHARLLDAHRQFLEPKQARERDERLELDFAKSKLALLRQHDDDPPIVVEPQAASRPTPTKRGCAARGPRFVSPYATAPLRSGRSLIK